MPTGPIAVVIGGSQGTGRAVCRRLCQQGYNTIVVARNTANLDKATQALQGDLQPSRVLASVSADITNAESVQSLAASVTEATGGRLDLLVNVAGVCLTAPFGATTEDDWQWIMESNFMGHVRTTRAFLPMLLDVDARRGSSPAPMPPTIAFVNSFGAVLPLKGMSAYTASKFALRGLAESLRPELAPKGVHVTSVHPGVIKSDFLDRAVYKESAMDTEKMRELLSSSTPGLQTPEEVADEVISAIERKKEEVMVGLPFQAAATTYRVTGANPFALAGPDNVSL